MNLGFFQCAFWKRKKKNDFSGSGFWFRILGYGLHFTNGVLAYSERNGFKKFLKLPFGFRCKFLKREEYVIDWVTLTCNCIRCKEREKEMDKKIKSVKSSLDKKMNHLVKEDIKRDKKCEHDHKMAKKKK